MAEAVTEFIEEKTEDVTEFIEEKTEDVTEFIVDKTEDVTEFIEEKTEDVTEFIEEKTEDVTELIVDRTEEAAKETLLRIFGPHPTLALVKFWQGAVEVCIRIAIIVLSVAVLVAASISVSDMSINTDDTSSHVKDLVSVGKPAAAFVVFTSVLAIIVEGTLLLIRFLNFGVVNRFFGAFVLINVFIAITLIVFYFSGDVALAINLKDWHQQQEVALNNRAQQIPLILTITIAFVTLTIVVWVILIVWLVLFYVYNWNEHMPTPSILSGLISGVVKAAEGSD